MSESLYNRRAGYCILHTPLLDLSDVARYVDEMLAPMATHIPVFASFNDWKPIGVSLDVEDYRVGGTGFIPLHIDFVNAEHPPDLVVFYFCRHSAGIGGESLLSNVSEILADLDPDELNTLRETNISEGKFFDLVNVGKGLTSFPLLDNRFLRFTGKKVRERSQQKVPEIMERLEHLAMVHARKVVLKTGDVLIVNQRLSLHGREPLSRSPNNSFPTDRLLYQRFYRITE